MIDIQYTETYGWEAAVRGMRNPKNSWAKSDSTFQGVPGDVGYIGTDDLALMQRLAAAGTDHGKFLRMIYVSCDVTAPLYWWKEADTYKVGTVADSCSTMHKIHAKEFELDDFSHEHFDDLISEDYFPAMQVLINNIAHLNMWRDKYNQTKDKRYWWMLIQNLPSSYNQRRTWCLNYAVLKNIYRARKAHKLDEWRYFCQWIETLPYAKELICDGDGN